MLQRKKSVLAVASVALVALVAWALFALDSRPAPVAPRPPPPVLPTDTRPVGTTPIATEPHGAAVEEHAPVLDGPGLLGLVRTARGAPVPGAEVAVSLVRGDERRELGRTRADTAGRFALAADLTRETTPGDATARIELEVRASGFQSKRETRGLADLLARATGPTLTLEIVVESGQDLVGRVVDARGTPRTGAEVVLWTPSLRAGAEVERPAARARTRADGRFALGFTSEGAYTLRARLENVGTFERAPLELRAGGDLDLGDLVLRGDGVLEGAIAHPDGRPAPNVELWAVPADLASSPDAPRIAAATLTGREHGDGLAFTRTYSDEAGRFRAEGLVPGRYALVAPDARTRLEPAAEARSTPAANVRLVLANARVCVRVVDAEGRPVAAARVACSRLAEQGDGEPAPLSTEWRTPRAPLGTACFDVAAETSYALRAEAGASFAEDLVHLAPGEYAVERTLVLTERANGRLRLVLETPAGADTPTVRVSLLSALTGEPLDACTERVLAPGGELDALPPGRYRAEIDPRASSEDDGAFLPLRVPGVIEIEPGRTTERSVSLALGARIDLELALDGPPPAGFEFRADPRAHPDDREKARREHELAHGALVTLIPRATAADPASGRALVFAAEGSDATSTLLPGRRARVLGLFAPGEYVLHATAEGFAPADLLVQLRAGERNELRLKLRAQ